MTEEEQDRMELFREELEMAYDKSKVAFGGPTRAYEALTISLHDKFPPPMPLCRVKKCHKKLLAEMEEHEKGTIGRVVMHDALDIFEFVFKETLDADDPLDYEIDFSKMKERKR